jgi:hypothetical protein
MTFIFGRLHERGESETVGCLPGGGPFTSLQSLI